MRTCPNCGRSNEDRARFCQHCAAPLERRDDPGHVRKTVTVLFTDVVGSTGLGTKLDPEATRVVMGRFFEAVRGPIERHGGTLEKYIGDAVMAVFGVPVVHEDDPLRACRAALEIRERLDVLNKELERDFGVTVETRTGVNTGEVVAGAPGGSQTLVTGDPVVTAARLEEACETGAILVGEATYRLVNDAVSAEPAPPVVAKGKAEPLRAHRLVSVLPGIELRTPRLVSPLIGREREVQLVRNAFERSVEKGTCTLMTIVGDPGVGKSRLAREAVAKIADRATILRGRCLPYGDGITFWPVLEVVRQAAGISDDMSVDEAMVRIEGLLPESEVRSTLRDRVAAAIGLLEGVGGIHETFWAIRQLLEELARRRPLIVVFEDIHWAEPTFLDLLEYLGERTEGPILLITLGRPELQEARPDWTKDTSWSTTLPLEPLGREENERLIANLLGGSSIPASVETSVVETAEGNPLFVEEMLGMLIDEERLVPRDGGWAVTGDVSRMPIPRSVHGVLTARIERLPAEQLAILQRASVVGRIFWWGAVAHLSPAEDQAHVGSHLRAMVHGGLIEPDETMFAGEDAFKFRHILIRDAAYASIPREIRSSLHERFADWMEQAAGERAEEYVEILGYHLEEAYTQSLTPMDPARGGLAFRASTLLASAARRAFDRDDIKAALNLSSRAARFCPRRAPGRGAIQLLLADSLRLSAQPHDAIDVLVELEQYASAEGDRATEWLARIKRIELLAITTNVPAEELEPIIDQALEVFSDPVNDKGLTDAWSLLAWLRINAGRGREAAEASEIAAIHARAAGDVAKADWISVSLTTYTATDETPVPAALELCRSTLDHFKGQLGFEANLSSTLGRLEAMDGNFEIAWAAIERARSIFTDLGVTHALASTTGAASSVAFLEGDAAREERELRSGHEAFRRMEALGYQASWAALLASSLASQGRDEEAFQLTLESEELGAQDDVTCQVPWREARARVLARRGEPEQAEALAREAVVIAERTDDLNMRGEAHMSLAEVLITLGRSDEAAEEFRAAEALYEQKGNVVALGWSRKALERLEEGGRG